MSEDIRCPIRALNARPKNAGKRMRARYGGHRHIYPGREENFVTRVGKTAAVVQKI
jgi:hypothetical protein